MEQFTNWLINVISGLVSNPEDIRVVKQEDEQGVLFTVTVNKEDTGKIIGKKGAISDALRVVVRSAGYLLGIRASMKVDTPERVYDLRDENR